MAGTANHNNSLINSYSNHQNIIEMIIFSVILVMDIVILASLTINIFFYSKKVFYQATFQRIK